VKVYIFVMPVSALGFKCFQELTYISGIYHKTNGTTINQLLGLTKPTTA